MPVLTRQRLRTMIQGQGRTPDLKGTDTLGAQDTIPSSTPPIQSSPLDRLLIRHLPVALQQPYTNTIYYTNTIIIIKTGTTGVGRGWWRRQ